MRCIHLVEGVPLHFQKIPQCGALLATLFLGACLDFDDASPAEPDATVTITIRLNTTGGVAGQVYARAGAAAFNRSDMSPQYGACVGLTAGAPRTCQYLAKIGQTLTLIANDNLPTVSIGVNTLATDRPDPRTVQSQFVSWSAPCTTPERGVCVLKVTGEQTVAAQYKGLSLTTLYFTGEPLYKITVAAPAELTIDATPTPAQNKVVATGDAGLGRCVGLDPGKQCVQIATPDNATIKLEALPVPLPAPSGSPGPLNFISWGGACASNVTNPVCNLTSGTDQQVTMKWQHYRCQKGTAAPSVLATSSWKLPANDPTLASENCTLVSG